MNDDLLSVSRVHKRYGERTAVDDVSFDLAPSEVLAIVGESGAGKSTLLRIIAALEEPSSGEVSFEGAALSGLSKSEMRAVRRKMQVVLQDAGSSLSPRWNVRTILSEAWVVHGEQPTGRALEEALEGVQLESRVLDLHVHELSGGQKQRIAIARALATSPRLLLLDEPLASLDVSIAAQIIMLLAELRARLSVAMVVVTHDLRAGRHVADRVAVMDGGAIVEIQPTEALFNHPESDAAKRLVGALVHIPAQAE